jgi:dihydroorotate dehydrogenase subfamily 1
MRDHEIREIHEKRHYLVSFSYLMIIDVLDVDFLTIPFFTGGGSSSFSLPGWYAKIRCIRLCAGTMTGQDLSNILDRTITLGRKAIQGRFVIPSGIRCTRASTIEWCFSEVESIGVVTTKSISLAPRAGYVEPIYARYAADCYINAVGLANPGAVQFRRELEAIKVPEDKFLLVSIFGGNVKQFVETAEALLPVADGFELNMSCPHAEGYGVEIGQNRQLVAEITAAVVAATKLPIIVKLSAIVGDVGQTAKAAIEAGAAGITVTNTIGPATVNLGDTPILSNRVGGLSGTGIRPLGLRAVKRVRDAVGPGPVVIGMGGIASAEDVRQFAAAGADLFGIGSALTGMDSRRMREYFRGLAEAMRSRSRVVAPELPAQIPMGYSAAKVVQREEYHPGLFKLVLDRLPLRGETGEMAGKYFFLFIPGVGEKPFAIFSAQERSIVVKAVGRFTQHLAQISVGSEVFLRGPYGRPLPDIANRTVVMVGGGTGIASLLEIGLRFKAKNQLHFLLGGRTATDLFDTEQFSAIGSLKLATNDGTAGHRGFVSDLLADWLAEPARKNPPLFILCGPEPMVQAGFKLLRPIAKAEDVWAAIEYITSCGVGICGKCASPSGALTCIDGPFLTMAAFERRAGKICCGSARASEPATV